MNYINDRNIDTSIYYELIHFEKFIETEKEDVRRLFKTIFLEKNKKQNKFY